MSAPEISGLKRVREEDLPIGESQQKKGRFSRMSLNGDAIKMMKIFQEMVAISVPEVTYRIQGELGTPSVEQVRNWLINWKELCVRSLEDLGILPIDRLRYRPEIDLRLELECKDIGERKIQYEETLEDDFEQRRRYAQYTGRLNFFSVEEVLELPTKDPLLIRRALFHFSADQLIDACLQLGITEELRIVLCDKYVYVAAALLRRFMLIEDVTQLEMFHPWLASLSDYHTPFTAMVALLICNKDEVILSETLTVGDIVYPEDIGWIFNNERFWTLWNSATRNSKHITVKSKSWKKSTYSGVSYTNKEFEIRSRLKAATPIEKEKLVSFLTSVKDKVAIVSSFDLVKSKTKWDETIQALFRQLSKPTIESEVWVKETITPFVYFYEPLPPSSEVRQEADYCFETPEGLSVCPKTILLTCPVFKSLCEAQILVKEEKNWRFVGVSVSVIRIFIEYWQNNKDGLDIPWEGFLEIFHIARKTRTIEIMQILSGLEISPELKNSIQFIAESGHLVINKDFCRDYVKFCHDHNKKNNINVIAFGSSLWTVEQKEWWKEALFEWKVAPWVILSLRNALSFSQEEVIKTLIQYREVIIGKKTPKVRTPIIRWQGETSIRSLPESGKETEKFSRIRALMRLPNETETTSFWRIGKVVHIDFRKCNQGEIAKLVSYAQACTSNGEECEFHFNTQELAFRIRELCLLDPYLTLCFQKGRLESAFHSSSAFISILQESTYDQRRKLLEGLLQRSVATDYSESERVELDTTTLKPILRFITLGELQSLSRGFNLEQQIIVLLIVTEWLSMHEVDEDTESMLAKMLPLHFPFGKVSWIETLLTYYSDERILRWIAKHVLPIC